jgi:plasmid stabilization system protein ParE
VAKVILSARLQDDFERIFDHLFQHAPDTAADRIESIIAALDVLASSPLIGRPVENSKRELVIATGTSGYLALYRFVPELDTVFVLGVRSQRELGFGTAD